MTRTNRSALAFFGILAAVFLVAGLAVSLGDGSPPTRGRPVALGDVRLVSVSSCDELLDWYRTVATDTDAGMLGGGYGGDVMFATGGPVAARESSATTGAAAPAADQASGAGYSTTNVQERGVDEPDTVKTNGEIIVTASYDKFEIIDVGGDGPRLVATLPLEQGGTEILLSGDRVLALTTTWRADPNASPPSPEGDQRVMMMPVQGKPVTVLTSIDISDPANPRVIDTKDVDGTYRTARATGTSARVVVVAYPQLPAPGPMVYDSQDQTVVEQRLEEWKTQAIASMTIDDWAPVANGDCSSVTRTSNPEGLGSTSILTFDLQGSLDQLDSDTIVADAGTVYASTDRLFIATSRWSQTAVASGDTTTRADDQVSTELHSFDTSDASQTVYVGSGAVQGYLLNQWSLSEQDGFLRVATTQEAPWDEQSQTQSTQSGITVLAEQADALVEVGRVDGLGVTERIQAVRYIGDLAYVVTFRQTDPLYVIDLSDPTAPRVAGELKVNGYSAYLHPIDDGRLIGVGQDATDEGQVLGTQVGTFDVTNPASPSRIDTLRVDGASSAVEYDPRAFLWWDQTRTVVIPIEIYPTLDCPPNAECLFTEEQSRPFMGAVAFGVGADGSIVERGSVSHDGRGEQADGYYPVIRSLVVGDSLYTISDAGVLKSDLSSLADQGFAQFPTPDYPDQPIGIDGGGTSGSSPGIVTPVEG